MKSSATNILCRGARGAALCVLALSLLSCLVPVVPARAYAQEAQAHPAVLPGQDSAPSAGSGQAPAEDAAAHEAAGPGEASPEATGTGDTEPGAVGSEATKPDAAGQADDGADSADAGTGPEASDEGLSAAGREGIYSSLDSQDIAEMLSDLDQGTGARAGGGSDTFAADAPGSVQTFAGPTMFETAVAEAKAAYPSTSTAIIVGPGEAWVDALAATSLAGALDCPILFTEKTTLHAATSQALTEMGVSRAVVIGGPAAVAESVVSDLSAKGIALMARLGGADCFDTQMKIYDYGKDNSLWNSDMAVVATGNHYGDALSISPVAFAKKLPVFLADGGNLRSPQEAALVAAAREGKFSTVAIAGGPDAVSMRAEGFLRGVGTIKRLSGATQYETSAEVARWAVGEQGFTWNNAAFATGAEPYDALAGSVLQGKAASVLLLVGSTASATIKEASANKASISHIRFLGGTAAIEPGLRNYIIDCVFGGILFEKTGISLSRMAGLEGVSSDTIDPDQWSYEERGFYQFARLNSGYSGKVSAEQIDAFIAKNCTYQESNKGVTSKLRNTGAYFVEAARNFGVNEVYLVAHAVLESGWGTSKLAQGAVPGYEGYLNFYGIGAHDLDANNAGAALAKSKGWTTPQTAINGAAEWIAKGGSRYLNNEFNQNTLYKMRWNYEQAARDGAVWKQYATDPNWPTGIANVMASLYSYSGIDKSQTGLKFIIPQYS